MECGASESAGLAGDTMFRAERKRRVACETTWREQQELRQEEQGRISRISAMNGGGEIGRFALVRFREQLWTKAAVRAWQ
jgi:hypothetical protein